MRKLWLDEAWEEYLQWQTRDKKTPKVLHTFGVFVSCPSWTIISFCLTTLYHMQNLFSTALLINLLIKSIEVSAVKIFLSAS